MSDRYTVSYRSHVSARMPTTHSSCIAVSRVTGVAPLMISSNCLQPPPQQVGDLLSKQALLIDPFLQIRAWANSVLCLPPAVRSVFSYHHGNVQAMQGSHGLHAGNAITLRAWRRRQRRVS